MKLRKLLKDEKGAVLPIVTLILGLFALGFTALVVDVGTLYIQRKAMITSADASALAGAQVLRVNQEAIKSGDKTINEVELEAKTTAKNYAIANGADENQLNLNPPYVGQKLVTLPNGATETRQVVEVTVGKNQSLIFARFLGDENADVKAHAIATWGYVKTSGYLPLFIFNTGYNLNTNISLHDNVTVDDENILKTNSYGFIQVGASDGMSDIKKAIDGTISVDPKSIGDTLDGAPGKRESVYDSAFKRIGDTVIMPIIDWEKFKTMDENIDNKGNIIKNPDKWKLPIMFFAYFKITNVTDRNDKGTESVEIEGEFTERIVEARIIVEVGDQIDPNPEGDTPATYSKLIR